MSGQIELVLASDRRLHVLEVSTKMPCKMMLIAQHRFELTPMADEVLGADLNRSEMRRERW